MKHVNWKEIADELLEVNWGQQNESAADAVRQVADQRLILCLLIDIAQSLRILRCRNFQDIPWILKQIRGNTKKRRRTKKEPLK